MVLISLSVLILVAHGILLSPAGYRDQPQIHRIIREKSHVVGPMGDIVEWQSLRAQEYRYSILVLIARFGELFGVRRPLQFEQPPKPAGQYEEAMAESKAKTTTLVEEYLENQPQPTPKVGGKPKETGDGEEQT